MTALCSADDVTARPELVGRALTADDQAKTSGYIGDASVLIEGYLGHVYDDTLDANGNPIDPVPDAARVVCARMVASALTATPVDPSFDQYTSSMGPLAATRHVAQDVLGGGVWLTRQDKLILDGIATNAGMSNVAMYDERPCPTPTGWSALARYQDDWHWYWRW